MDTPSISFCIERRGYVCLRPAIFIVVSMKTTGKQTRNARCVFIYDQVGTAVLYNRLTCVSLLFCSCVRKNAREKIIFLFFSFSPCSSISFFTALRNASDVSAYFQSYFSLVFFSLVFLSWLLDFFSHRLISPWSLTVLCYIFCFFSVNRLSIPHPTPEHFISMKQNEEKVGREKKINQRPCCCCSLSLTIFPNWVWCPCRCLSVPRITTLPLIHLS